jgi:two-component system phosphate regulon sensor histidine kinase PhoR
VEQILSPPEYSPQTFRVLPFVEGILDDLRERSRHRLINLVSHIEDVQTDALDPNILRLVLETLVKNAVENTPDDGEVSVSVQQVPEGILVQVRDHGVGIPVEDQEFIFEGFHHTQPTVEYSTKKPFDFNAGGAGLELLRLKALAEIGYFEIAFETSRCKYVPTGRDHCPGAIASCPHVQDDEGCRESGGTTFSVLFRQRVNR